jgi:hypothetical protein
MITMMITLLKYKCGLQLKCLKSLSLDHSALHWYKQENES